MLGALITGGMAITLALITHAATLAILYAAPSIASATCYSCQTIMEN